jgi:hypothetical protein
MPAMPATTPPALRSGAELDRATFERAGFVHEDRETAVARRDSSSRLPFSTKGKVPVATTIVLFTIVGALIAFIALVGSTS